MKTVSERFNKDNGNDLEPIDAYYEAIKLASEVEDQAYVDLFKRIINREKAQIDRV